MEAFHDDGFHHVSDSRSIQCTIYPSTLNPTAPYVLIQCAQRFCIFMPRALCSAIIAYHAKNLWQLAKQAVKQAAKQAALEAAARPAGCMRMPCFMK
jgi:hypothetical protein